MSDSGKRKLSAKEILSDIRSGMDGSGLKHKYDLSDKALELVLTKLSAAGALTERDVDRLNPAPEVPAEASRGLHRTQQWRCPACNVLQPQEMSECPACGVVVSKFAAHQGQGHPGARAIPVSTYHDVNESSGGGGWTYVVWSIVVLAVIGGAVIAWSIHRSGEKAELAELERLRPPSPQAVASRPEEMASQEESTSIAYPQSVMESFKNLSGDSTSPGGDSKMSPAQSKPTVAAMPPAASTKYVTGVLRQFNSSNFKTEVVEASKTYPVLFQFYSDT
jgi:hypothetical protein